MVKKFGLVTTTHPKPYTLHRFNDGDVCVVIPMNACHTLLGCPCHFERGVVHRGRSNEYELKHNGMKIMLSPMSSTEVQLMNNKKSSLTILASEKEVEQVINKGEEIFYFKICIHFILTS